jgi:hypothetical protein
MKTEGRPYRDLLETFIEPILKAEGFTAIPGGKPDPAKAPEMEGSLNIEGLAASGNSLLIGFRNPQPTLNGTARALVVELKNPAALITATPAAPEKGAIFKLDLGGRGIRSFEALPAGRGFAIVAGPFNDIGAFALYRWDGTQGSAPVLESGVDFSGFNPEALFLNPPAPGSPSKALSLTLLSDDGGRKISGEPGWARSRWSEEPTPRFARCRPGRSRTYFVRQMSTQGCVPSASVAEMR